MNNTKLNQYEQSLVQELKVELDGETYKGYDLIGRMVTENAKGNYRLYNMATGGIGTYSPTGNLLAKLGIE